MERIYNQTSTEGILLNVIVTEQEGDEFDLQVGQKVAWPDPDQQPARSYIERVQ